MNIKFNSSVIITKNLILLKNFYTQTLNLEIEFDFGNCIALKGGISIWELKEDYSISKNLGRLFSENGNNNLELCFETDNLDEVI